jgi:hypothetical protein
VAASCRTGLFYLSPRLVQSEVQQERAQYGLPLLSPGLFPAWRPLCQDRSVVPAVLAPDAQRVFRFVTAMHRHVQQKHSWHAKLLCGAYFEIWLQVRLHLCLAQSMAQFKTMFCFHMCCDCLVHTWSFKCH